MRKMERALYNTVLGGVELDGTKFFYVNLPTDVVPRFMSMYRGDET